MVYPCWWLLSKLAYKIRTGKWFVVRLHNAFAKLLYNAFMSQLESLNEISKKTWGGKRPNAGRTKGSKNKATLDQAEAKKQFQERVAKNVDRLFNAQLDKALGEKYLMVITTTGTGSKQKRETTVVTDPEIIKQFLDSDFDSKMGEENEYYFMSTKPADNMALDSLLNRSFGRATEKVELEHSGEIVAGQANPVLAQDFANYLKAKNAKK